MKKLALVLVLGAGCLWVGQTYPATVGANFSASVTLTSVCRVKTGSDNLTLDFGTYTAFGAAKDATSINVDFECTRGFAATPSVSFDTGTDKTSTSGASASGVGVVSGLQYSIGAAAGVQTAGSAATTASIGTPDTYRYVVSGTIAAAQAGTTSTGIQTQARVVTITY
ncbi:hypothetical protein [Cupriavidus sp. D39]|uniref:hypothetical protein n=1 Tax=Cupriavidus sp. D39 TaxID=2997877 RepID=UPI0022700225|nr:hypothetical protein [Cupriavidus sp. D39]MCY0858724.1 hypothetical protein [Cupriavidus sp. D39]